jgi:hypothetical protein
MKSLIPRIYPEKFHRYVKTHIGLQGISLLTTRKAKFDIDAQGFTANEEDMLCLKIKADFRPKYI